MPVPTTGNFNIFGTANTTIQGAIVEGGASGASTQTDFNSLINLASISKFDPLYSGDVVELNNITQSIQFRNYPKNFTAVNIGTNLGSGFSSSSAACSSGGSIATVYLSDGGIQSLYEAFINGKILWANTSLTTPFDGGNLWFKTTTGINDGDSFQIGTDGFIQSWGGTCAVINNPAISCGVSTSYKGGQSYPSESAINLGSATGITWLNISPRDVPDRFIVLWDNVRVIDTGYVGSQYYNFGGLGRTWFKNQLAGKLDPTLLVTYPNFTEFPDDGYPLVTSVNFYYSFNKSNSNPTSALVRVYAPGQGTVWSFNLGCPGSGQPIV
jgi:hypothetical protein